MGAVRNAFSKENLPYVPLAAVGAAKGLYETSGSAAKAWALLGVSVLAYEVMCPAGETLSEACDRALDKHKLITLGAIAVTAAHLANVLPQRIDPLHQLTQLRH